MAKKACFCQGSRTHLIKELFGLFQQNNNQTKYSNDYIWYNQIESKASIL